MTYANVIFDVEQRTLKAFKRYININIYDNFSSENYERIDRDIDHCFLPSAENLVNNRFLPVGTKKKMLRPMTMKHFSMDREFYKLSIGI